MSVAVNVAGGLLESLQVGVFQSGIGEVPHVNVVGGGSAQFYRAGFTKKVEGLFQVLGIDIGGALNGTDGAVFELHHRHADVLALQVVVELLGGLGVDLLYLVPHHPAQQIHAVDALVHHAATVLGPGAAPRSLVIVVLVPVPAHMDGAVGQLAEPALLQGLPGGLDGIVEPVLVAGAHLDVMSFRCLHDGVCVRHGHGHGLFNDDIHAVLNAVQGDLCMEPALGGDSRQLRLLCVNHLFVIRVAVDRGVFLQPVLGQQSLHGLRLHVAHGGQLQLVVYYCFDVVDSDTAAADENIFHRKDLLIPQNFMTGHQKKP